MKKFVKIIAFVTICLLTSMMLYGCSDNGNPVQKIVSDNMSTTQPTEITEYEYVFAELPSEGNEIEGYRKELKKRIETNTYKSEEEIEFLEKQGYFIYTGGGYFELRYFDEVHGNAKNYSDPIVFQSGDGFEVWAINKQGELCSITIEERGVYAFNDEGRFYLKETRTYHDVEYHGLIHYTAKEGEEIIASDVYSAISYEPATGLVKEWEYGELIRQAEVPAKSIYVGASFFGYLFKDSNDVWAVQIVREDYSSNNIMWVPNIIAHNVEFVIAAKYSYKCEPLFLMTDGTLKTYSLYDVENDVPIDDKSHLIDVVEEGNMM